jgi:hypothetical protein
MMKHQEIYIDAIPVSSKKQNIPNEPVPKLAFYKLKRGSDLLCKSVSPPAAGPGSIGPLVPAYPTVPAYPHYRGSALQRPQAASVPWSFAAFKQLAAKLRKQPRSGCSVTPPGADRKSATRGQIQYRPAFKCLYSGESA